jgi:hypothetical protein
VLLNCEDEVLGPLTTLHAPVPTEGLLPERVAVAVTHIVCAEPLVAVVGEATTVIVASAVEAVQGALLIVHLTT